MSGCESLLRRIAADPLLRSAYSLVLNVIVTSALGIAFWITAARIFPAGAVGRGSALVSAMIAVSTVCGLNLSSATLRFLPISKLSPAHAVLGAYGVTALLSAVGGVAFVLIAPQLSTAYTFLACDPVLAVLWVGAVVAWGIFTLQDAVLAALREAPWVPVENSIFGAIKLVLLPALFALGAANAVFIAWAIPMVLLLVPVNFLIFRLFIPARRKVFPDMSPVEQFGWRGLARFVANDYLALILVQVSSTLLPALVAGLDGSVAAAYFYMPFTIVGAFDTIFFQVCSSLTVEAAMDPSQLTSIVRRAIKRFGGLLVGGVILLVAGATELLLPFGQRYVHGGSHVLVLMACASPFRAIVDLYCAVCRIRGSTLPVLTIQACLFVLTVGLTTVLGGAHGLLGVGLAWLVANAVTGIVVLPDVVNLASGRASRRSAAKRRASVPAKRPAR